MNLKIKNSIPNIQEDLTKLCIQYEVKTMYFFGSICTERFDKNSDVDILIGFKDLSIEKYTENYFELHYALEKLFSRKIDLLTENSLSNPYFIKRVNESKQLVYVA